MCLVINYRTCFNPFSDPFRTPTKQISEALCASSLAIESETSIRTSCAEHFITSGLRQPLDSPECLICLAMCRDAGASFNGPDLYFPIKSTTEKVFSSITPIDRSYPGWVASQVANMFAVLGVINSNNACVASGSKACASRWECHCPDGFNETYSRVRSFKCHINACYSILGPTRKRVL